MNYEERIKIKLFRNAENFRAFKKGDYVFREGDPGQEMFVIRNGSVDILVGQKKVITLEQDEVFGEMALVDHQPRSATVIAASDCELVPIDERHFHFLVTQTPNFATQLLKILASRLRQTNSSLQRK